MTDLSIAFDSLRGEVRVSVDFEFSDSGHEKYYKNRGHKKVKRNIRFHQSIAVSVGTKAYSEDCSCLKQDLPRFL